MPTQYSDSMLRSMLMLALAIFVGGTMAVALSMFFRRLKKIEKDFWGEKSDEKSGEKKG